MGRTEAAILYWANWGINKAYRADRADPFISLLNSLSFIFFVEIGYGSI